MNIRAFTLTLILVIVLLAAFAAFNWVAITALSTVSLGYAEVVAPLGLVLLGFAAAIGGLFVVYIVLLQAGVILEVRRLTKALSAQSALADTAEASRMTALQAALAGDLRKLEAQATVLNLELGARLDRSERDIQQKLAEATGTFSAYLGEIDDKLDRMAGQHLPLRVAPPTQQ